MSADARLLEALAGKIRCELRYFELVTVQLGYRAEDTRQVYLCVGHHALFLVRCDLSRTLQRGGEIRYEWIDKFVVDSGSRTNFKVSLNRRRPAGSDDQFLIVSEHRSSMLKHISICYVADGMHRLHTVVSFPKSEEAIKWRRDPSGIEPFKGYRRIVYGDYSMFIREEFADVPNAVSVSNTGVYKASARVLNPRMDSKLADEDIQIELHVYDPMPLAHLGRIGREHIRWVATEYKQALIRGQATYVPRNQLYLKKMNLSNDMAAWICWELVLQDEHHVTIVMLLRRQYVPPIMDTVQDFAVILKSPTSLIMDDGGQREGLKMDDLLHEAHLVADTLGPHAQNTLLYPDIIQAKLDSLLYDEEAYGWIKSRLRLRPDGASCLEKWSCIFVKGILKILRDEGVLSHPELWEDITQRVNSLCDDMYEQDLDPLVIVRQKLQSPSEGLSLADTDEQNTAWQIRVSKFLAHCVDGGLMGTKFTLADMVSPALGRKTEDILSFLLHLRPKDLQRRWELKPLTTTMLGLGLLSSPGSGEMLDLTFNDRVMQVVLEVGFLHKSLPPDEGEGSMSAEYAHLLCNLLQCNASSVSLRASICRQIIAAQDAEQGMSLFPGLVYTMRTGGLFLATYACAALVNLSQANGMVKNALMLGDTPELCVKQLQSQDDDLVLYTLMLLVHLTKMVNHRSVLFQAGLLPVLYDILTSNYAVVQYKRRLITELCSVLGQMCNDEECRKTMLAMGHAQQQGSGVIECLHHVFTKATAGLVHGSDEAERQPGEEMPDRIAKVLSKVLFALKQLCANSANLKDKVGAFVVKDVLADLACSENLQHQDWAVNAVMLILLFSLSRSVLVLLGNHWSRTFKVLSASGFGQLDATRDRILQIERHVDDYLHNVTAQASKRSPAD